MGIVIGDIMDDNKIEEELEPKYRVEEPVEQVEPYVELSDEERLAKFVEEDMKRVEENKKIESATFSTEDELIFLRNKRNQLLISSDWTQLSDVPEAIQSAWKEYRQQLRDLPSNFKDLQSITWPKPPSSL